MKEGNPLVEPLVLGGDFLLLKVAGAIFPRLALTAASGMVAFYGAVAFWNALVLLGGWLADCA